MDWVYLGRPIDEETLEDYVGFVYVITNTTNGKKYLGKKLLKFSKTKQVKGKKKKIKIASDWKTYYGSSNALKADVEAIGEDKFTREILQFCKTKGECSYVEAKLQFQYDVLKDRDAWYNDHIWVRVHRTHLPK